MGKHAGECRKYCRDRSGLAMTSPRSVIPPCCSVSHAGLRRLMCRRQNGQYRPRSMVSKTGVRRRYSASATVPSPSAAGRLKSGARSPGPSAPCVGPVICDPPPCGPHQRAAPRGSICAANAALSGRRASIASPRSAAAGSSALSGPGHRGALGVPRAVGSLDNFIRPRKYGGREVQPERPGSPEIDRELELRWLLDRKITGLGAPEDLVYVSRGAPVVVA